MPVEIVIAIVASIGAVVVAGVNGVFAWLSQRNQKETLQHLRGNGVGSVAEMQELTLRMLAETKLDIETLGLKHEQIEEYIHERFHQHGNWYTILFNLIERYHGEQDDRPDISSDA